MPDLLFSGDIPRHYDAGLGPVMFHGYADDLAARVASAFLGRGATWQNNGLALLKSPNGNMALSTPVDKQRPHHH